MSQLSKERWEYLKQLKPSEGRYLVTHEHPNRKMCRNKLTYVTYIRQEVNGKEMFQPIIVKRNNKPYRKEIINND